MQSGTDNDFTSLQTAINAQATVARSTGYAVGSMLRPPAANGLWYRCSTAGTTAASAPTYNTVAGGTTTDGTAVFTAFLAPFILQVGDSFDPHCHAFRAVISGTLTNTNPSLSSPKWFQLLLAGTGNYTSGQFAADGVTPLRDGVHFEVSGGTAQYADTIAGSYGYAVRTGGRITLIGGTVRTSASILYEVGAIVREYRVKTVATRTFGSSSARFRALSTDVIKRNCEHYDLGYDMFRMPTEFSVKGFGAEYVSQYVGAQFGGADAKFTASALANTDGTYDFDNYGGGWVELYDSAKGAMLNIVCQQNISTHCVPLYQNVDFTITNLTGMAQQNVRYICTDAPVSNSPTATITTASNLKTWDFRNAQVYTGTTNASGQVRAIFALKVHHGSSNLLNLRFPSSTATVQLVGYAVRQQAVTVVLGSDTPIAKGLALVSATNLTLTEAQAAAITGVSFVASGTSGGTFTNTGAKTASQIWHAWRNWKGLTANAGSADSWEFDGETLNMGAWNAAGDTITGTFTTTGTITAPVNGLYTDAAGSNAQLTLTGLTAGSAIYVANGAGAQVDYVAASATSYTLAIAPGATGTWVYRVARYGFQTASGTFTPGVGGVFGGAVTLIPVSQVVDTLANVQSYTDLNSAQRIYDALSLYGTTNAGIIAGQQASRGFGTLTVPNGLTLDPAATNLVAINGGLTVKCSGLAEDVTILSSAAFTQGTATLSNAVKIRASNLDSELLFNATSITLYPSAADRDAGINAGPTSSTGIIRFKSGATVSGVVMGGNEWARVNVGVVLFSDFVLNAGANVLDLGTAGQLAAISAKVDAKPTLAQMEGSWKLTNSGLIDLGVVSYWEYNTSGTAQGAVGLFIDPISPFDSGTITATIASAAGATIQNLGAPQMLNGGWSFAQYGGITELGEQIGLHIRVFKNGVLIAKAGLLPGGPTLVDIESSTVIAKKADLTVINDGVKKASLLVPHSTNLS